jgi:hypothetical protein
MLAVRIFENYLSDNWRMPNVRKDKQETICIEV